MQQDKEDNKEIAEIEDAIPANVNDILQELPEDKRNAVLATMNYMAKKGWILDKTYYVTEGAGRAVLHYVLVKRVKNDNEIREGLITKDEQ